ncbi:MAG: hypothetical protein BWY87_01554 [Deltaproteobacteria bacterium ADurb.Bin510]|nr:MAG: hypothetical protein BWY87_01554 [Deltaproteobacteria bacterium ADurb.Bin510]
MLLVGVIGPTVRHRAELKAAIVRKDAELRQAYELSAQIRAAGLLSGRKAGGDFNLMGFVEETAAGLGIKDRIEYMKPIGANAGFEIKLNGIYTEDLVAILFGLKNAPGAVTVTRLSLRRVEQSRNMDVTLQVKTNA